MTELEVEHATATHDSTPPPSIADKLEGVLYHFVDLFEKIQAEKTVIKDQASRIEATVNEMKQAEEKFTKLSGVVRSQLDIDLTRAANRMEERIGQRVGQLVTEKTDQSIQALQLELRAATETLRIYRGEVLTKRWTECAMMTFCAVTTGIALSLLMFYVLKL